MNPKESSSLLQFGRVQNLGKARQAKQTNRYKDKKVGGGKRVNPKESCLLVLVASSVLEEEQSGGLKRG